MLFISREKGKAKLGCQEVTHAQGWEVQELLVYNTGSPVLQPPVPVRPETCLLGAGKNRHKNRVKEYIQRAGWIYAGTARVHVMHVRLSE